MNPDRMTHVGATIFKKSTFICVGGFKTGIRINEDLLLCGLIAMRGNYVYVGDAFHVYVGGVSGQATSLLQSSDMSNILYVINTLFESIICYGGHSGRNLYVPERSATVKSRLTY